MNDPREQAFSAHERGDLPSAYLAYQEILHRSPNDMEIMHALGVLAVQIGQYTLAANLMERLLTIRETPEANAVLGNALLGLSQYQNAVQCYDRAIALQGELPANYLNRGHALRHMGRREEAIASYEQAAEIRPEFVEAHMAQAGLLLEACQWDKALRSVDRAIQLGIESAEIRTLRGLSQAGLGRTEDALQSYGLALSMRSDCPEAYINRAVLLRKAGRLDEALADYGIAIELQPDSFEAYVNRSAVLTKLGYFADALADCEQALRLRPDRPDGHLRRAEVLAGLDRHVESLAVYDHAAERWPHLAAIHQGRGAELLALQRPAEALAEYDRVIQLQPDNVEAHLGRGIALQALDRFDQALMGFDRALALKPDSPEAHFGRGNVLAALDDLGAALESYDRAVQMRRDYAEACSNRGAVYLRLRQMAAAAASYDQALAAKPDYADAHYNKSMVLLLSGQYAEGWAEFEWRWKISAASVRHDIRDFRESRWYGDEPITGKTILLHSEQGLGDTLQFCRFASLVAGLGARVILEVPKPLVSLLAGLPGVSWVVARGDALPAFDCWCPLMSLPLAFKTTLADIPAQVPYLKGQDGQLRLWADRLGAPSRRRVGLVWSGGFRPNQPELHATHNRRNIPLKKLVALNRPDIEFFSLQKGQPAESELAQLVAERWDGPRLADFTSLIHDFSDTAALIEQLDLIISVDTSTAHLAGALGKPVWILNRYDTCWRWMLERTDSPWYPTAKLYRQKIPGDWDEVVQRVARDLDEPWA
jgi:tetratricopeptide (TPR) repeat protein